MNCLAALSKMDWSSSPIVVTEVMVLIVAAGEPPITDAWVDYSESWKSSSLNGLSSLYSYSCLDSLSLCKRETIWSLKVGMSLVLVLII